jgi:hypothetical protein
VAYSVCFKKKKIMCSSGLRRVSSIATVGTMGLHSIEPWRCRLRLTFFMKSTEHSEIALNLYQEGLCRKEKQRTKADRKQQESRPSLIKQYYVWTLHDMYFKGPSREERKNGWREKRGLFVQVATGIDEGEGKREGRKEQGERERNCYMHWVSV